MSIPPIESAEAFIARVEPGLEPPFQSRYRALTLDHLDDPGEEHSDLIAGWLSESDRSVIGGPSKAGKSFLSLHAALCIAFGMDFFGNEVKQGLVVYQAGEGARGVKKRLRAWAKHHGVRFDKNTPFVLLQAPIDLYSSPGDTGPLIEEIKAIAKMFKVPLRAVFIDTLATATGGADENSGKDMGTVMQNVAKINAATGAHVCLVHHLNAGGTKLRGHTSIYANIDQVVLVTLDPATKVRTAVLDKQKDGEDGLRFQFELMRVELDGLPDRDGRPPDSCVCLPVGEKAAIRKREEAKGYALKDDEIVFMQALFEAEAKHGSPVPEDMHLPAQVRAVVRYEEVKRAWARLTPSDDVPQDEGGKLEDAAVAKKRHFETLKKRLQRMRQFLTSTNIIGVEKDLIWWTGRPLRAFPNQGKTDEVAELTSPFSGGGEEIPF